MEDRYMLIKQIGSGSFGSVYLGQDNNNNYIAAKVEHKTSQRLFEEYKTYKLLNKYGFVNGLPKVYQYLETPQNNIMIMQLLGKNLDELYNDNRLMFDIKTVMFIGLQITNLLEGMHNSGFIHRDIKPNNFLLGCDNDVNHIYIMDFGLSKRYLYKNKHMKMRVGRSLIGTARYASINVHMGIEPSRRDDLESVIYMLIYFLKGHLPWQGLQKMATRKLNLDMIGEIKIITSIDVLCSGLPVGIKLYLEHCRSLGFHDKPDYDYLKRLLKGGA